MEDASLDEFLDAGGDDSGTAGEVEDDVDPATATVEYSPAGAVCEECGCEVRRRWHSESGPVCGECKDW